MSTERVPFGARDDDDLITPVRAGGSSFSSHHVLCDERCVLDIAVGVAMELH